MHYKIAEDIYNDGGPRAHLLATSDKVIDDGASILMDIFHKDLGKVCYLNQPVLTNIRFDKVAPNGHIVEGYLDWTCEVTSLMARKKAKINLSMPIVAGYLCKPIVFTTSTNFHYPLSENGIKKALMLREVVVRNRTTPVLRSYREEN